jgi:exopolysaccharide biosynthesis polyprenyl glycosylphosphotransferase
VRVTRELAHRRFAWSVVRRALRLASLHALDSVAIVAGAWTAAMLSETAAIREALPALVAFVLVGLNLRGSYRPGGGWRDTHRLLVGLAIGCALAALPTTINTRTPLSLEFLALFFVATLAALIVERQVVNAIVHAAYVRGIGLRRALIVARASEYRDVLADIMPHLHGRPAEDQVIVGYVSPEPTRDAGAVAALTELDFAIETHDASEVIVATALDDAVLSQVADGCFERGVRVLVIPPASSSHNVWAERTQVGRLHAYQLHPRRLAFPSLMIKRVTDLVLASIAAMLAAPLFAVVAVAIKLESRGPVFFRQRRVGLGGRHFMMWKFRSMRQEAESRLDEVAHLNTYRDARLFKLRDDPRITRVGRALRRFSLDELPQLLNVLSGDMSLVGPRPPLPDEVRTYEPRHMIRLSVVPGMTGPWQVNGRNLITDFEEVVRLEREYIETWSLRQDGEILLRTVGVVLSGNGAY